MLEKKVNEREGGEGEGRKYNCRNTNTRVSVGFNRGNADKHKRPHGNSGA